MEIENQSGGIASFLTSLERRMDRAIEERAFDDNQRALLNATVAAYRARSRANPLGDPLALYYLIARAERGSLDEQGQELAVFCQFYILALDLLDDVQDDDLSGKSHAEAGPAIAINSALTLLFLGMSALERAMRSESNPERSISFLSMVNRVALLTSRGQHRDLAGVDGKAQPYEVLDFHREKTASLALICECAARYASTDATIIEAYRRVGEEVSLVVQVLDDVRDIYGKSESPDLTGRKPTYPLAWFFATGTPEQIAHFEQLRAGLPATMREIRALFHESGVMRTVACTIDGSRRAIHHEIAELCRHPGRADEARTTAAHRTMLFAIDSFVSSLYAPKTVEASQFLFAPATPWHTAVRRLAAEFRIRMAEYGAPETPPLIPWHLGQWMYDAGRNVIFYPDHDGMPEETLRFQAELLGVREVESIREQIEAQAPAVLAHELFHHFRDVTGRLTENHWQEELAANALSVEYCREFEPEALEGGLRLARLALARPENQLSPAGHAMVEDLLQRNDEATATEGYGFNLKEIALVQLAMIDGLAARTDSLPNAVERMLSPRAA